MNQSSNKVRIVKKNAPNPTNSEEREAQSTNEENVNLVDTSPTSHISTTKDAIEEEREEEREWERMWREKVLEVERARGGKVGKARGLLGALFVVGSVGGGV